MLANPIRRRGAIPVAAATLNILTLLMVHAAVAGPTPEQKCEAGKNDTAGKYAACLAKAEKGLVGSGDMDKYAAALAKCDQKLTQGWAKLEGAAIIAGGACPSFGDRAAVGDFVEACAASIAAAVSGDPLGEDVATCNSDLAACGPDLALCDDDLATCDDDLATCDVDLAACVADDSTKIGRTAQHDCYDNTGADIPCAGSGQDGQFQAGDALNFVDNGDGTITDRVTGLMWEKLSDDGSVHDLDTVYSGLTGALGKVTTVNAAVFAGHNDWRLPNVRELESITDVGRYDPAISPVFHTGCIAGATVLTGSCTKRNIYISSTTYRQYTQAIFVINMQDGDVYASTRTDNRYVRLVRTAS